MLGMGCVGDGVCWGWVVLGMECVGDGLCWGCAVLGMGYVMAAIKC